MKTLYANLILKIKNLIRKWLGIGEVFVGVDLSIRDETCIVIVSRLGDGTVEIKDLRFGSYIELRRYIGEVQHRYGIPDSDIIYDMPLGMDRFF